jgi:hypothetical protein
MGSCVQYFEQQSYSPFRIDRYKFLWKSKLIPFMVQKSFLYYDPSVGEEYIRSNIAGSIVTPYERDIIRSINVLSEFQEKGTISTRHCKPLKRELSGQIGQLMDKFLSHLEALRRNRITISDHRLYLSRFLSIWTVNRYLQLKMLRKGIFCLLCLLRLTIKYVQYRQSDSFLDSYMRKILFSLIYPQSFNITSG